MILEGEVGQVALPAVQVRFHGVFWCHWFQCHVPVFLRRAPSAVSEIGLVHRGLLQANREIRVKPGCSGRRTDGVAAPTERSEGEGERSRRAERAEGPKPQDGERRFNIPASSSSFRWVLRAVERRLSLSLGRLTGGRDYEIKHRTDQSEWYDCIRGTTGAKTEVKSCFATVGVEYPAFGRFRLRRDQLR